MVAGWGSCCWPTRSVAQEPPAGTSAQAPAEQVPPSNLTLFIPYGPDDHPPLDNARVFLPHDEFLRLWKQAHPEENPLQASDVRAVVSYAEYVGRLENDTARFHGRLVVHQFDDRWVPIALPLGDVAMESAAINGQPAAITGDPPAIYLEKAGLHVVDIQFSVPVSRLGATGRFTVPLRAVPAGRLLFRLPVAGPGCASAGRPGRLAAANGCESASKATVRRPTRRQRRVLTISSAFRSAAATDLSVRWQPRREETRGSELVSVEQIVVRWHPGFRHAPFQRPALSSSAGSRERSAAEHPARHYGAECAGPGSGRLVN